MELKVDASAPYEECVTNITCSYLGDNNIYRPYLHKFIKFPFNKAWNKPGYLIFESVSHLRNSAIIDWSIDLL